MPPDTTTRNNETARIHVQPLFSVTNNLAFAALTQPIGPVSVNGGGGGGSGLDHSPYSQSG